MKIFGYNIGESKAPQAENKAKSKSVEVVEENYRIKADIDAWRDGQIFAEDARNPSKYELTKVYNEIVLDSQVKTSWGNLTKSVLSKSICFYVGEEKNEEVDVIIQSKWFKDAVSLALDAYLWGDSLLQFGDLDDKNNFLDVKQVSRVNVNPYTKEILKWPTDSKGVKFDSGNVSDWYLFVQYSRLGILNEIAPYAIIKKYALQSWAEYCQMFGIPPVIVKSNSSDKKYTAELSQKLQKIGSKGVAVIDIDDVVEALDVNRQDAYSVFLELIKYCDDAISKIILGQTMTTDSGSSLSQAQVHQDVMNQNVKYLCEWMESFLNDQLKPFLENLGFVFPEGEFEFEDDQEISSFELLEASIKMMQYGEIDNTWLMDKFGIPFKQNPPQPQGGAVAKK